MTGAPVPLTSTLQFPVPPEVLVDGLGAIQGDAVRLPGVEVLDGELRVGATASFPQGLSLTSTHDADADAAWLVRRPDGAARATLTLRVHAHEGARGTRVELATRSADELPLDPPAAEAALALVGQLLFNLEAAVAEHEAAQVPPSSTSTAGDDAASDGPARVRVDPRQLAAVGVLAAVVTLLLAWVLRRRPVTRSERRTA